MAKHAYFPTEFGNIIISEAYLGEYEGSYEPIYYTYAGTNITDFLLTHTNMSVGDRISGIETSAYLEIVKVSTYPSLQGLGNLGDFVEIKFVKGNYSETASVSSVSNTYSNLFFFHNGIPGYMPGGGGSYFNVFIPDTNSPIIGYKYLRPYHNKYYPKGTVASVRTGGYLAGSSWAQIFEYGEVAIDTDPFAPGGNSGSGGGSGSFSRTGDDIGFPSPPTLGAVSTGLVSLYNPSIAELQNLSNYMWSDAFTLDSFKKIFADPMDVIIGLSIVPVAVPDGGQTEIKIGNISTGISMNRASNQYVTVDCGAIAVSEYWGAYLDYSPFTKLEIYLPYIGYRSIDVDDVMGKSISVRYVVDILSGACTAMIKCGDSVMYSYGGACGISVPVTSVSWAEMYKTIVTAMVTAAGMGASADMVTPALASTANAAMSIKGNYERSGGIGANSGMLGVQTPYLIMKYPNQCLPEFQNAYTGYPAFITLQLTEVSGYTEIAEIRLSIPSAVDEEKDEIERLLKEGVIF